MLCLLPFGRFLSIKGAFYLFPEQKLGTDYIVDYMLIGKNSDGYSIVLVEFEDANTDFILKFQQVGYITIL